jgi:uncharacterized protein
MLNRAETLAILGSNADAIRAYGATALHLFGSAARDELRPDSDVDLFIDYDQNSDFDFFALCRIEEIVKSALGREIDLTTRAGLHPGLRERIEQSSVRVF